MGNMKAKISKIDYILPERIRTNEELSKLFPEWTAEAIEEKIGIAKRHIVCENETAKDLAVKVGQKILDEEDKDSIDFLILCTQSPDYYLPTTACILQHELGLRTNIGALDFNLGCSGYIYGLGLCKGLIEANIAKKILFITSETYSKHINSQDKSNLTIFGDAATATIIECSETNQVMDFVFGTDGKGASNLIIPNGGLRNKYDANAEKIEDNGSFRTANNLYMNGPEIFNFTIQRIPSLIKDVLTKHNLTMEELDYCVFHQANKYMLEYLKKKLKIPDEKFCINMKNVGNTVSSTIPIALRDCIDNKTVKQGDLVLLAGFGVGYSWGGTVIQI
jgi:3-oxoacyl-[acyl-carrier-protein] synthase-3